jgi:uncharacterized protein with LGFP repeats
MGPVRDYLNTHGGIAGDLGWPTTDANAFTANGGGTVQGFQGGAVMSSSGGTFLLTGQLRDGYNAAGSVTGPIGWPTSEQSCTAGTCTQTFQSATISISSSGITTLSVEPITTAYKAAGGASGSLGKATSPINALTSNGGGFVQAYQKGAIAWSSGNGAHVIAGQIRDSFNTAGGIGGYLGWPTGDVSCDSSNNCSQAFSGGTVYVSAQGTSSVMQASIRSLYDSMGGASGTLGDAIGSSNWLSDAGGGFVQAFTNGAVTYTSSGGAVALQGDIRSVFGLTGGISGPFGWPTGQASNITTASGNGIVQAFQHGAITSSETGTFPISGPIRDEYSTAGGITGALGWPTSSPNANNGGLVQAFQNGAITWTSGTGAHVLSGPFRTAYATVGGIGGKIGWPTSDQIQTTTAGGGTIQSFQTGAITLQAGTTTASVLVSGPIRDYFNTRGGLSGPLGWPTSSMTCSTATDCTQAFTGGTVTWNATTGPRLETK